MCEDGSVCVVVYLVALLPSRKPGMLNFSAPSLTGILTCKQTGRVANTLQIHAYFLLQAMLTVEAAVNYQLPGDLIAFRET